MLNNDRGNVSIIFIVVLNIILLFLALGMDLGRAFVLKHELQTVADAGALAGTSMTEARINPDGTIRTVIVDSAAEAEALAYMNKNITKLNFDNKVKVLDMTAYKVDDVTYHAEIHAVIGTILAGPLIYMITGDDSLKSIKVSKYAEAKVRNP